MYWSRFLVSPTILFLPSVEITSFLLQCNVLLLQQLLTKWSDFLLKVLSNSLVHYAKLVQQFCACEVIVKDVKNIVVNIPADSIYKTKVHTLACNDKKQKLVEIDQYISLMYVGVAAIVLCRFSHHRWGIRAEHLRVGR